MVDAEAYISSEWTCACGAGFLNHAIYKKHREGCVVAKGFPASPACPHYAAKDAEIAQLRNALTDMLAGWRYIRAVHGDLYGVGWDRAQTKAENALRGEGE